MSDIWPTSWRKSCPTDMPSGRGLYFIRHRQVPRTQLVTWRAIHIPGCLLCYTSLSLSKHLGLIQNSLWLENWEGKTLSLVYRWFLTISWRHTKLDYYGSTFSTKGGPEGQWEWKLILRVGKTSSNIFIVVLSQVCDSYYQREIRVLMYGWGQGEVCILFRESCWIPPIAPTRGWTRETNNSAT